MRKFPESLNETTYLPMVFTALGYLLLVTLHLIEKQTCRLVDLLSSFRMTLSPHMHSNYANKFTIPLKR